MPVRLSFLIATFALCGIAAAQESVRDSSDVVAIRLIPSAPSIAPGAEFPAALMLDIKPGWHIWTNDRVVPEDVSKFDGAVFTSVALSTTGSQVRIAKLSAEGWSAATAAESFEETVVQWPDFHLVKADVGDGVQNYPVFEGKTVFFVPLSISTDAPEGIQRVTVRVELQACNATSCVAPATIETTLEFRVQRGATSPPPDSIFRSFDSAIFAQINSGATPSAAVVFDFFDLQFSIDPHGSGFFMLLFIAAVGGLLLNFTPCVLPVIPLKIMGLSRAAGNRHRCLVLGVALSVGVVLFWIGLGLAVALISDFTSSSQLFHYPIFTITVGVIIALMATGLCGFFSIPIPQSIAGIDFRHDTIPGAVGFGVMTAVLSTPCTAPLMGAAAAWAATQAPWIVLTVFGVIGLGMALPYFILSAFPQLVSHVPKSGPASDVVKQTMGLLLLAAAAYFVGAGLSGMLAVSPEPPSNDYWWVVSGLGTFAGVWLFWRTIRLTRRTGFRVIFCSVAAFIAVTSAAIGVHLTDDGEIKWSYYTPEVLAQSLARGDAVLIDFTAEWCLNCKTLEKTVLESSPVIAQLKAGGIQPIKVDLTGNNEAGRALLRSHDRVTIPLLVILAPDGTEIFKSDAYTPSQVVDAIKRATSKSGAAQAP